MKPENVPLMKLLELARVHARRFQNMLTSAAHGEPGIRAGECEHYLALWQGLEDRLNAAIAKRPVGEQPTIKNVAFTLTEDERDEVSDAITCGDYDELLGIVSEPEDG